MDDLKTRPMTEGDYPFVKATWLRNYREQSEFARPIRKHVYFDMHGRVVDAILARAKTLIAYHAAEPEVVLGFIVHEERMGPVVHYAYVVEKARRMGIGRDLFQGAGLTDTASFTHRTRDAAAISARHSDLTYNPYLL